MNGINLVKNTLDQIPQSGPNAKRIVGLVKESGRITGYKLSDESIVSKPEAVAMPQLGQIAGRPHRPPGGHGISEIHSQWG